MCVWGEGGEDTFAHNNHMSALKVTIEMNQFVYCTTRYTSGRKHSLMLLHTCDDFFLMIRTLAVEG